MCNTVTMLRRCGVKTLSHVRLWIAQQFVNVNRYVLAQRLLSAQTAPVPAAAERIALLRSKLTRAGVSTHVWADGKDCIASRLSLGNTCDESPTVIETHLAALNNLVV